MIRAREVRLIAADGSQAGIVPLRDALRAAEEAELDLVEIAPNAEPPVCRIEDYKKVLYEKKKRERAARKKQKTVEIKEVKVRPNIDPHDFEIKMKRAMAFLCDGAKVKVTMMFRGREIPTAEQRAEVLKEKVTAVISEYGSIESFSRASVRQKVMILAPKPGLKPLNKPLPPDVDDDHDDDEGDDQE